MYCWNVFMFSGVIIGFPRQRITITILFIVRNERKNLMKEILNHRELTCAERVKIRKLVKDLCANLDQKHGCLLLGGNCYMSYGVAYTNTGMCKYFRESVLPTHFALETVLIGAETVETRSCGICNGAFPANRKQAYCSDACAGKAQRKQQREYMRKKRNGC